MLADSRRFRVLVVIDDFIREFLALVVDTSISGRRVARELDPIVAARKRPLINGERQGTPQQPLPDQWVNENVFRSLPMARLVVEAWRLDHDACRPHTSLGGLALNEFGRVSSLESPHQ